jgi:Endonuclease-reverse transcriptase
MKGREDSLWLHFKSNCTLDICIGFVYRHPDVSKYVNPHFFEQLNSDIMEIQIDYPDSEIVIMGDFNARIGSEDITEGRAFDLWSSSRDEENIEMTPLSVRRSKDKVVNQAGRNLINVCDVNRLSILNGKTVGDNTGEFTFTNRNGSSVIDIGICSKSLITSIVDFRVENRADSQHLPIALELKYNTDVCNVIPSSEITDSKSITKYKWFDRWQLDFERKIKCYKDYPKIDDIIETDNLTLASLKISELLTHAGSNMIIKKTKAKQNLGWFNRTCQESKTSLLKYLRKFQKCNTAGSRGDYITDRNRHAKVLQAAKDIWSKKQVAEIHRLEKEPHKLWSKIQDIVRVKDAQITGIDPEKWKKHFSQVLGTAHTCDDIELLNTVPSQLPVSVPELDGDISPLELERVTYIRKHKAAGIDGIPIEFVKQATKNETVLNILCNLLNKIRIAGKCPPGWNTALLIPI